MTIPKKPPMSRNDSSGKKINNGDWVRVPKSVGKFPVHRDYNQLFHKFSGRTLKVVGWDNCGFAWLDIGSGVLSIEPLRLTIVRRRSSFQGINGK